MASLRFVDKGGNVQTVGCGGLVPLPICTTSADCDDGFYCSGSELCIDNLTPEQCADMEQRMATILQDIIDG